jgi:hypothetical protein
MNSAWRAHATAAKHRGAARDRRAALGGASNHNVNLDRFRGSRLTFGMTWMLNVNVAAGRGAQCSAGPRPLE